MEKGRYTRRRRRSNLKALSVMLVAVLLIGCAVGGTIAYFTDQSEAVTNTFVVGAIGDLDLKEESTVSKVGDSYLIVPGIDITKDPKVTYTHTEEANNVSSYVFVKVTTADVDYTWQYDAATRIYSVGPNFLVWKVDDYWKTLKGVEGVYYTLTEGKDIEGQSIIYKDMVKVSPKITQENIEKTAKYANGLTFTAYAIQAPGFADAAAAWDALQAS